MKNESGDTFYKNFNQQDYKSCASAPSLSFNDGFTSHLHIKK